MTVPPSPTHSISRFDADLLPVVEFLSYVSPVLYSEPYFNWKVRDNPFGASACFLRYRDGNAVAQCSITAKPANEGLAGRAILGELGDTHTHPDFQRQGHFSALGKCVIDEFSAAAGARGALIYGLPNEQALPGWTRSVGCQIMEGLGIHEMLRMPWQFFAGSNRNRGLVSRYTFEQNASNTASVIDEVWRASDQRQWLVAKDSRWWAWRYSAGIRSYHTHVLRDARDQTARAWVVSAALRTRFRCVNRVAICDVVGRTPVDEAAALTAFLRNVPRITDMICAWFQDGTRLAFEASMFGFRAVKSVPVIFANNDTYRGLRAHTAWFRMSLGDSDNV